MKLIINWETLQSRSAKKTLQFNKCITLCVKKGINFAINTKYKMLTQFVVTLGEN